MAGNNKSTDLEMMKRMRVVQEWILMDIHTRDIINKCVQSWGISDMQAKRYIKASYDDFVKLTEKSTKKRLAYHLEKRKKLIRQICPEERNTARGVKVELEIVKDMAELEMLYVRRHEISGKDGKPIEIETKSDIDYTQLSNQALEEIVNARRASSS